MTSTLELERRLFLAEARELSYEREWSACSRHCARLQTRIQELEAALAQQSSPVAPVGVEAAEHWHGLYRKECQLRQDDAARYGQQIVDLEAAAQPGDRNDGC